MLRLGRLCDKIESLVRAKMVATMVVQCWRLQVGSQVLRAVIIEVVIGSRQVPAHPVDHGKAQHKRALIMRVAV